MDALEKESGGVGNIACDGFYIETDIQEIERVKYQKEYQTPEASIGQHHGRGA